MIAYAVRWRGIVHANYGVDNGVLLGEGETWQGEFKRVTADAISIEENIEIEPGVVYGEALCLNGEPFTGALYDFDQNGFLTKEEWYRAAIPYEGREWYESGALKSAYSENTSTWAPDFYPNRTAWYESGEVENFDSQGVCADFSEHGHLTTLLLRPGYSSEVLNHLLKPVSKSLQLYGEVDDQVVANLSGLENVAELTLHHTNDTAEGLQWFSDCHLRELLTEDNNGFCANDVRQLLERFPGCKWDDRDALLAWHDKHSDKERE